MTESNAETARGADHPELSREACIAAAERTRRASEELAGMLAKPPAIEAADLIVQEGPHGWRLTHKPTGAVGEGGSFVGAVDKLQRRVDALMREQGAADAEQFGLPPSPEVGYRTIRAQDLDLLERLGERLIGIEARITRLERGQ